MKPLNTIQKTGLGILLSGVGLAILISFVSTAMFGRVYFFDGYTITAILWSLAFMMILVGVIVGLCGMLKGMLDASTQQYTSPNPSSHSERRSSSKVEEARAQAKASGAVYFIEGVRGRMLTVYEDKVIITTRLTAGSFLVGNATDGEKTIYFVDCIGVQYKKSSVAIGYLQFETASAVMNNKGSNMFNENSFTWDVSVVSNETMEEVANFAKRKIDELKRAKSPGFAPAAAAPSSADELKKYKELLDLGVITQEEFDAKKKQLLGL